MIHFKVSDLLLRLAADPHQLPDGMAGGHPGHRRRAGSYAGTDLLLGIPTHIAVGTDLFEVAISGLYGAATYTYKGRIELFAALIMLSVRRSEHRSVPWPPSTSKAMASESSSAWP